MTGSDGIDYSSCGGMDIACLSGIHGAIKDFMLPASPRFTSSHMSRTNELHL